MSKQQELDVDVDVEYLTRVEGHGNIVVNAEDGELETCEWQVVESPRFFESMVKGRSWDEVAMVTSRICGICSISHSLASLKATEDALDIFVSTQDRQLRKLALYGEIIQSHVLHVGYLALPDLVDSKSVVPMAESHPDDVETVVKLHRLGNEMTELFAGRDVHATSFVPGGFSQIPDEEELEALRERLAGVDDDLNDVVELLVDLAPEFPDFERETEYVSLTHEDEYAFYDGVIESSDTGMMPVADYRDLTNEYVVPQSTAKYAKHARDAYLVGSLARFNNNYDQLSDRAKAVAEQFDLSPQETNPYLNTVAQVVETAHLVDASIEILDEILDRGLDEQEPHHKPEVDFGDGGRGVGAVDVPRGILFHEYEYDENGECVDANCVIPTNQNHGNIQQDMEKLVPEIATTKSDEAVEKDLEMLVRAYDPCISCSTHYLDVDFVNE
jgi:coenzyme F420-reducing hydrogenase alpha subunit